MRSKRRTWRNGIFSYWLVINVLTAVGAIVWLLGTVGASDTHTMSVSQCFMHSVGAFILLLIAWMSEAYRRIFSEKRR